VVPRPTSPCPTSTLAIESAKIQITITAKGEFMSQKQKYEDRKREEAYARGREDAAKPGQGEVDPVKLGAGLMTAGMSVPLTGLSRDNYNPPTNIEEKEAYDRGWNDEKKKGHVEK
jgi:hypothetical protein